MKNLILAFVLAVSTFGFGQSTVDVGSAGNNLKSTVDDTLTTLLGSPVNYVSINGTVTEGPLGTLTLTTPALATGDFQTGGTFGSGGLFYISAPGYVDYIGNFSDATWTVTTLANGNHTYTLTGDLTSTEGAGSFFCQTVALPRGGVWVASAKIAQCQVNLSLVF